MNRDFFNLAIAGAGLVAVGLLVFIVSRGGLAGAGKSIGAAAAGGVLGAVDGVVVGIGGALGVPETSESECDRAIREGRTWDASFACPAGRFLRSIF